jgi:hemin uptake protein HemP
LPDQAGRPRVIASKLLLQGERELWIEHGGEMYRLRETSRGKLYLTK